MDIPISLGSYQIRPNRSEVPGSRLELCPDLYVNKRENLSDKIKMGLSYPPRGCDNGIK